MTTDAWPPSPDDPRTKSQKWERQSTVDSRVDELGGTLALRDGTVLHWRAIHADDAARLRAFHGRLSRQSLVFRFFGEMPVLSRELAARLCHVDYEQRMAIVATTEANADAPVVAVARYELQRPGEAEFALVVEDRLQGQGIGPRLLRILADYASGKGITTFVASVMYDNDHMLAMLRHCGFPATHHLHEGRIDVQLDISKRDG